jgi:hypothetical protein
MHVNNIYQVFKIIRGIIKMEKSTAKENSSCSGVVRSGLRWVFGGDVNRYRVPVHANLVVSMLATTDYTVEDECDARE